MFGRAYDDASVLKVGCAIEKLMGVREQLKLCMLPKTEVVDVFDHQYP